MNSLKGSGGPPRNLVSLTSSWMLGGTRKADVAAAKPATSVVLKRILVFESCGDVPKIVVRGKTTMGRGGSVALKRRGTDETRTGYTRNMQLKEVVQGKRGEVMTMRQDLRVFICLVSRCLRSPHCPSLSPGTLHTRAKASATLTPCKLASDESPRIRYFRSALEIGLDNTRLP